MSSGSARTRRSKLRRIAAVAALLGLVFATTIASVAHSLAMPMMAGMAEPLAPTPMMADHDRHDHDQGAGHQHQHGDRDFADGSGDDAPGMCKDGCLLCKDCSLCSFTGIVMPAAAELAYRLSFAMARFDPPADTLPSEAIKPPRI